MNLKIIFEDEQIFVVEKPAGLVVNQSETVKEETLQDQLSSYLNLGSNLGIGERAGIVHRLDRETSGLMLVAKTQKSFEYLQAMFKSREVKKTYIGLVHGKVVNDQGTVDKEVGRIGRFGKFGVMGPRDTGGKQSQTDFEVIERYKFNEKKFQNFILHESKVRVNYLKNHAQAYTLLKFFPKTGRTHQIRVHAKSIGNPVVSDAIYAPSKLIKFDLLWCRRLLLHAQCLEFVHPRTKRTVSFESNLPKDLKNAMLFLEVPED